MTTSATKENVEKVKYIMLANCQITAREAIEETVYCMVHAKQFLQTFWHKMNSN